MARPRRCALAARITFFHAVPDAAAGLLRGDAELLRASAHGEYDYAYHGKAGELLAKAKAAARALGVPCDSQHVASDRPAQAVSDAARRVGCDLIFMASHGHGGKLGMALSSETLSVLTNSGLPVLVSSTGELPPPARAIGIIRDEHRSLAALMQAWLQALAEARRQRMTIGLVPTMGALHAGHRGLIKAARARTIHRCPIMRVPGGWWRSVPTCMERSISSSIPQACSANA